MFISTALSSRAKDYPHFECFERTYSSLRATVFDMIRMSVSVAEFTHTIFFRVSMAIVDSHKIGTYYPDCIVFPVQILCKERENTRVSHARVEYNYKSYVYLFMEYKSTPRPILNLKTRN